MRKARHRHVVRDWHLAGLQHRVPRPLAERRGGGPGLARHGQLRPAPVDPQIVADLLQHLLRVRADVLHGHVADPAAAPNDTLLVVVHRQLRTCVKVQLDRVAATVGRADCPAQISDRPRQHVEIVG
jgi:hypothetical protein